MACHSDSPKRATYLLLGAGFETNNLGVAALASGALAGIWNADPTADVAIGDYSRKEKAYSVKIESGECNVALLPFRFSWRIWLPNNIFRLLLLASFLRFLPKRRRSLWTRSNRWFSTIDSAEAVLAVNGGDSCSDIYGLRRLVYVLLPQFLVLQLGKPLVLLPQTYGPFRHPIARWLAGSIFKNTLIIATRENGGERAVQEVTRGMKTAEFSHDMAFLLQQQRPSEDIVATLDTLKVSSPGIIGLNISGLLWMGGYTRDNSFGVCGDYRELMERLVSHLIRSFDCRILLIPHVCGEDGEGDLKGIREFLAGVPQQLRDRLTCLEERCDQHEIKWVIGQCDFFIGSRMHACIAALSQAVPAVGLAYSDKFRGVFKTIAAEKLAADLRTMDVPAVIALVDKAYRDRLALREELAHQIPMTRATLAKLFRKVAVSCGRCPEDGGARSDELCLSSGGAE